MAALATLSAAVLLAQWTPLGPWGGPAGSIDIDPQQPSRLVASSRNGHVFVSTDAARTWSRVNFPSLTSGLIEFVRFHPKHSDTLFAGVADERGETSGLYLSHNGGSHWRRADSIGAESVFAIAFFPANPAQVALGLRSGIALSRDGGQSFSRPAQGEQPAPVMSLAFDVKDGETIYAGTTHLPWKSTDGGRSWRSIHAGMLDDSDVFSLHVDPRDPARVFASACSGIYLSASGGEPWRRVEGIPGTDRRTHVITNDPEYSHLLMAGTTAGLWKSADAGETWRKLNGHSIRGLAFDPRNSRVVYMATFDRGILKSTTAGLDFVEANRGFAGRTLLRFHPRPDGSAWAAAVTTTGAGQLLELSRDGTWSTVEGAPRATTVAEFGGRLYVGNETGLFVRSSGAWRRVPIPGKSLRDLAAGEQLFLIVDGGVWASSNGQAWKSAGSERGARELAVGRGALAVRFDTGWRILRGGSWASMSLPPGRLMQLAVSEQVVMAATTEGLFRDTGAGWSQIRSGLPEGYLQAVAHAGGRRWITAQAHKVFQTSDDGGVWVALPTATDPGVFVQQLSASGEFLWGLDLAHGAQRALLLP